MRNIRADKKENKEKTKADCRNFILTISLKLDIFTIKQLFTMVKIYFTNAKKLAILANFDSRIANGHSLSSIARSHQISPKQLRQWNRMRNQIAAARKSSKRMVLNAGRKSTIQHLEERIVRWVLQMRSAGLPITYSTIITKAGQLDDIFHNRPYYQQYKIVRRLCRANCLVLRRSTHVAQTHPDALVETATEWLLRVKPILNHPTINKHYVLNMDQTAVTFTMSPKRTLDLEGKQSIIIQNTTCSTNRFTVSLTIAADGSKLKPFFIFKGAPNGRIVTREFSVHPYRNDVTLNCQKNAWQDEDNMLVWITTTLVPHLQANAAGAPVYLLLDSLKVHHTERVINYLSSIGVRVEQIPAGCTGILQPIDVGVGKPFKDRIRTKYLNWMHEQGNGEFDGRIMTAVTRNEAIEWSLHSWNEINPEIIRNAWMKTGFHYFDTI